ncbi:MAG: STAS domain-containing protein [Burkholderiales bacterium]|nr:STAS domain-containing protein [Burkholderiales bacterium]
MSTPLALPSELTIYTVGDLRPSWLAWMNAAGGEPWRVDGAAVAEVDAAGVQMLVALAHSAAAEHQAFALENPSPALATACRTLGLQDLLTAGAAA